jgi:hypothetical protein
MGMTIPSHWGLVDASRLRWAMGDTQKAKVEVTGWSCARQRAPTSSADRSRHWPYPRPPVADLRNCRRNRWARPVPIEERWPLGVPTGGDDPPPVQPATMRLPPGSCLARRRAIDVATRSARLGKDRSAAGERIASPPCDRWRRAERIPDCFNSVALINKLPALPSGEPAIGWHILSRDASPDTTIVSHSLRASSYSPLRWR